MSAYVIVDIDVHDAPGLEEYRKQVPATVAMYGGRFVVRGGKFETLEGHWQPKRLVVLESPASNRPSVGTTPRSTARSRRCDSKRRPAI
jgi:uncharacterized protein (DUF1330 family)